VINMSEPFIWFDLATDDSATAAAFYRDLFGWDIAEQPTAGYQAWIGSGQPWAGITATGSDGDRWLPYVTVADLVGATKKAEQLGATVVRPATDGPAGTSVVIADPGGAQLALFTPFPADA
jgi:predicted enzyme related to lactoylglutathione lyase